MTDVDSAQPVRSQQDGDDERVHVKLVDGADPDPAANKMQISELLAHVRDFGQDPANTKVQLRLSEQGWTNGDGVHGGTNSDPSNIGVVAMVRNIAPAESQQTQRVTAISNQDGSVRSMDMSLHDEVGEPYTQDNPMPVSMEESEGDEIHDTDLQATVAKDVTANHDYTVTAAKVFQLEQLKVSGSGIMKLEVLIETGVATGVFDPLITCFNSASRPNIDTTLRRHKKVAAGVRVRLALTNLENQSQDLYSTIIGLEKDA